MHRTLQSTITSAFLPKSAIFSVGPILLALACLGVANRPAPAQSPERPNVLFIFLDDFGWRDCGFMGSDFYETPHLDKLAAEGMIFSDAYASAANCAPSRACLLSGQYTPRHEIFNVGTELRGNPNYSQLIPIAGTSTLRPDIRTWAQCIQDAGYSTGSIGKWHLSNDPLPYGFDLNVGGSHSGSPPRGYFPPHPNAPGLRDSPPDEYLTDRLTAESIAFIEENQDRPWLLYLTHFAVHTPLQAKQELQDKYEAKSAGELHSHAVMAAMIESVDVGVGEIIAKLEELGLNDKTAIIFTSDNGGYGPATDMSPLSGYKGTFLEGGIRVPFFVKWPGVVEAGTRNTTPIINVDLFPTLCEITQAELPAQPLDGTSLVPLFKQQAELPTRSLFWHFPTYLQSYARTDQQRDPLFRTRPCSVIRDGDWKLHEYFEDHALELFNLREDIGERNNLADELPDKTRELHRKLIAWRQATDAPVPSETNPAYDPIAESIARLARNPAATEETPAVEEMEFIYPLEGRPTPQCHASTIAETPAGLVAAWFGGSREKDPDVGIWLSRKVGDQWSTPVEIVDGSEGEEQDYACWNPVLFQPREGPLMLFYKVGVSPSLWWGALTTSADGGHSWSEPRRLGTSEKLFAENQSLIGPVKNKPIELDDGTLLCPSSTENEGWRVHVESTSDLGQSWQIIGPLQEGEQLDAIQPSFLVHGDGKMQMLCRTQQGVVGSCWSHDGGKTWGPMARTQLPNPNSGTDAVTLKDGRHLLVYNHSRRTKNLNGREILNVALSSDGKQWDTVLTLENESGKAEFSYPAVIQASDGMVHITYTWQRQTIKHVVLDPQQF